MCSILILNSENSLYKKELRGLCDFDHWEEPDGKYPK